MTSQNSFGAVCALLMLLAFAQSQQRTNLCEHRQEKCECNTDAEECYFELEVEELQTFTSYKLDRNGNVVTQGTPGDTYFWQEDTLTQSIDCDANSNIPECSNKLCSEPTRSFEPFYSYQSNECSLPMTVDGSTYRLFIAVNGRIPGPTLVVTEGQIVIVKVINKLTSEGITIHWHGMHQRRTPWMDGVAFVSQAPIVPGANFTYIFKASPYGTHWYHSHAGAQRTDGLFGALIVRENPDTRSRVQNKLQEVGFSLPPTNQEHTLTFLDWQRESSLNLFVQLHSTLGFYPEEKPIGSIPNRDYEPYRRTVSSDKIEVGPNPFWSGLINGHGRHYNGERYVRSKLSIFDVTTSQVYRFRLIGAQSLFAFNFSIDEHKLTVIASDGHFIQPEEVDFVIIHTGERYDVLVTADQPVNNYWIRAETLELKSGIRNSADAILHYNGASDVEGLTLYDSILSNPQMCTNDEPCRTVNCPFGEAPGINCTHLHELTALLPSDLNINKYTQSNETFALFNFGFEGSSSTSAINGRNFKPPVTPYQTYSGAYNDDKRGCEAKMCNQGRNVITNTEDEARCKCTHVKEIRGSSYPTPSPIVFVLSAVGLDMNRNFSHPVHLHGHSFSVLHIGHGTYNESGRLINSTEDVMCDDAKCRSPTWSRSVSSQLYPNANMRIQKDTVIVPAGGYVVIAFEADNPGYWFMHCHIESHQLEGMGVIIQEYPEEIHADPPANINKVGDFDWTVDEYKRIVAGNPTSSPPSPPSTSAVDLHLVHIGITLFGILVALF